MWMRIWNSGTSPTLKVWVQIGDSHSGKLFGIIYIILIILKGCRINLPKICHFGMWTTLSWKQSRACGLKRNERHYYSYLNYVEKSKLRGFPKTRILPKIILSEWQTSDYQTSALLALWIALLLFEALAQTLSVAQDGIHASSHLSHFEPLVHVGLPCVRN